jgi:hypothetical protein
MKKIILLLSIALCVKNTNAQQCNTDSLLDTRFDANVGITNKALYLNNTIIVAGKFTKRTVTDTAQNIAAYNTNVKRWYALVGKGVTGSGTSTIINDMVLHNNEIYVAGKFSKAGSVAVNNIAKYNLQTNTWSAINNLTMFQPAEVVTAITFYKDTMYYGITNPFQNSNGRLYKHLGTSSLWVLSADAKINAIQASSATIVVAGEFGKVNAVTNVLGPNIVCNKIAKLENNIWQKFAVEPPVPFYEIKALTITPNNNIYVGGLMLTNDNYIFKYNGATWDTAGTISSGSDVRTIYANNNSLIIGGKINGHKESSNPTQYVTSGSILIKDGNYWTRPGKKYILPFGTEITYLSNGCNSIVSNSLGNIVAAGELAFNSSSFVNGAVGYPLNPVTLDVAKNNFNGLGLSQPRLFKWGNNADYYNIETIANDVFVNGKFNYTTKEFASGLAKFNNTTMEWDTTFKLKLIPNIFEGEINFLTKTNNKIFVSQSLLYRSKTIIQQWDDASKTFVNIGDTIAADDDYRPVGIQYFTDSSNVSKYILITGQYLYELVNNTWQIIPNSETNGYYIGSNPPIKRKLYAYSPVTKRLYYTWQGSGYYTVRYYNGGAIPQYGLQSDLYGTMHTTDYNGDIVFYRDGLILKFIAATGGIDTIGGGIDKSFFAGGRTINDLATKGDTIYVTSNYDGVYAKDSINQTAFVYYGKQARWIPNTKKWECVSDKQLCSRIYTFNNGYFGYGDNNYFAWNIDLPAPSMPPVGPLSIHNKYVSSTSELFIYPNPTSNTITILNENNTAYHIINVIGQIVQTIATTNATTTIDVSNLTNGMFIIKGSNGAISKFIKE